MILVQLGMKIQTVCTCFGAPSTDGSVFLKNTKISIFGGISKFLELIVFGQILAILGSFRKFWAGLGRFCSIGNG
jgi:hypothetical protein